MSASKPAEFGYLLSTGLSREDYIMTPHEQRRLPYPTAAC